VRTAKIAAEVGARSGGRLGNDAVSPEPRRVVYMVMTPRSARNRNLLRAWGRRMPDGQRAGPSNRSGRKPCLHGQEFTDAVLPFRYRRRIGLRDLRIARGSRPVGH